MSNKCNINGVEFTPIEGVYYRYDYVEEARKIEEQKKKGNFKRGGKTWTAEDYELKIWRDCILGDLFFIIHFVMKIPGSGHPFVVNACNEVQLGPEDYTLDVWAREHYKSTIITIAETIQFALKWPEKTQMILSATRPLAKSFLRAISETFKHNEFLRACFPDRIWENPERDAPTWSLDEGLFLPRDTTRREPSISAYGLIEGMPTGFHCERRVYDDITTEDMADSQDMMEKVKKKYDSSQNLGTSSQEGGPEDDIESDIKDGVHRVVGTYYHHQDPLMYVTNVKDPMTDKKVYNLRFKPATHNGERDGKPVLISQKRLNKMKLTSTFDCQQLLDPSPQYSRAFRGEMLQDINPKDIPSDTYDMMLLDPAGDDEMNVATGDDWAMGVVGVELVPDMLGQSRLFIRDLMIENLTEPEGHDQAVKMFIRNGFIQKLCVEKVALSSTEVHIVNALRLRGRHLMKENGTLFILRPAGRKKRFRVESALVTPFTNMKIFISTDVPAAYRARLRMEMDRWFAWKKDGLDMLSYVYDVLADGKLRFRRKPKIVDPYQAMSRRASNTPPGQKKLAWMAS